MAWKILFNNSYNINTMHLLAAREKKKYVKVIIILWVIHEEKHLIYKLTDRLID